MILVNYECYLTFSLSLFKARGGLQYSLECFACCKISTYQILAFAIISFYLVLILTIKVFVNLKIVSIELF